MRLHHLGSTREWLLFLSQLLYDFSEFNNFARMLLLVDCRFLIVAQESLSCSLQLRESVVDHLLRPVNIDSAELAVLIDSLLRYPLIVMSLLGPQVAKIDIDFGKCGGLLVDLLVGGFTLRENAEVTVHSVAHLLADVHPVA